LSHRVPPSIPRTLVDQVFFSRLGRNEPGHQVRDPGWPARDYPGLKELSKGAFVLTGQVLQCRCSLWLGARRCLAARQCAVLRAGQRQTHHHFDIKAQVESGGPADKVGIKVGDRILEVDGLTCQGGQVMTEKKREQES